MAAIGQKTVALDTPLLNLNRPAFAMRFELPQTGLLSLLGQLDHEDTPHRRLLSGVGGLPRMSVRLSRPDERVPSLT